MNYKLLRVLRIAFASLMLLGVASFFLDIDGKLPASFVWLEKIQFFCSLHCGLWVVTLLATLLVGRIYCSIVCPLGILQDLISWLALKSRQFVAKFTKDPKTGKAPIVRKENKYRPERRKTRAAFLLFAIATSFAGLLVFGLLEPYGIFGRIAVNVFKPIYVLSNNILYSIFQITGPDKLRYSFYYVAIRPESVGALLVGLLSFIGIALFAGKFGRLYCNLICPVGTFLGYLSRWSLLKTTIDQSKCVGCGLCSKACKSSCIDAKGKVVDNSRCVVCFDCFSACKKDAIHFGKRGKVEIAKNELNAEPTQEQPLQTKLDAETLREKERLQREIQGFDRSKRNFIALSALTATAAVAKAASAAVDKDTIFIGDADKLDAPAPTDSDSVAGGALNEHGEIQYTGYTPFKREFTISPPGSRSHRHMMAHCVSCHLCVAKCPARVLKPSGFENGLMGFLQPRMDFTHGFCNFDCTVCADVCPAYAIIPRTGDGKPLTIEEKHKIQVGHVVFIKENCIVPVNNQHCGACSEHCPTQAVKMVPYGDDGLTIPETNVDLCVGCGGCEYICPARPYRAIYIEGNPVHKEATPPPKEESKVVEEIDFGF